MMDKRRYPRIPFREPVHYVLKQSGAGGEEIRKQEGACLSCDLSLGGLCLRLEDFIPLHTELNLDFLLNRERPIGTEGRVVWIQKIPHAESYQIGVQFDPPQQDLLGQEIQNFMELQRVPS